VLTVDLLKTQNGKIAKAAFSAANLPRSTINSEQNVSNQWKIAYLDDKYGLKVVPTFQFC